MPRPLVFAAILFTLGVPATSWAAAPGAEVDRPRPLTPAIVDNSQRIDVNRIGMFVTNTGSFAWDKTTLVAGLEFPRGSGKTAVFAAGPWIGAMVGGETRVALSEYSDEYGPGSMIGGAPDDPSRPEYKVYKLNRVYSSAAERDAALADYNAGAVPHGAPAITVQPDGSLDVPGDQMTWCVYNDADPRSHGNRAGQTQPLGVEVQETFYAYDDPGPLGNTVFLRFKIFNKGANFLEQTYVGLWSDPDVGGALDDLVGADPGRSLGFAYNAYGLDAIYASAAPAVGFDLLRGPLASPSGPPLGLTAITSYINGTDPNDASKSYRALQGLDASGNPFVDPTTGLTTRFMFPGDPLAGTGWIDVTPTDHRFLLGSGPFSLSPGESEDIEYALIISEGLNHLSSLASLRCNDAEVQAFFDRGEAPPRPVQTTCLEVTNCVEDADFWGHECKQGGSLLSAQQLQTIAQRIDARSVFFNWGSDPTGGFCAAVAGSGTVRDEATREFATFLSDIAASWPPVIPSSGQRIYLDPGTPVSCPGLQATNVFALSGTAQRGTFGADYLDLNPANPVPLEGVPFGGQGFNGGAGTAFDFLGSGLNPTTMPDSFMTVEIRFDHAQTQMAYRFLRLETQVGGAPPQGRGYLYAGFFTVPFTCWDVVHNVQLDVGFVERTITDDSGTILPAAFQLATFDSTWAPDASSNGGREYLFVYRRPYGGAPKPEIAYDGAPIQGAVPALYFLAAKRVDPSSVIDDGDGFRFPWEIPFGPDIDSQMIRLAGQPLTDPAVVQAYQDIVACLSDINRNVGIGSVCQSTPTLASLVSARAEPDRVVLIWEVSFGDGAPVTIERREGTGEWTALARRAPEANGRIELEDATVSPGLSYTYRLRVSAGGTDLLLGETTVQVPSIAVLALAGFQPNPAVGDLRVAFSLASREPARVELFDLAGRRTVAIELPSPAPGAHVARIENGARLASGIYVIRLTQGRRAIMRKAALIR